jgi:hypothetical protein
MIIPCFIVVILYYRVTICFVVQLSDTVLVLLGRCNVSTVN